MNKFKHRAVIALGANLGNRKNTLEDAWRLLNNFPEIETKRLSSFLENDPVGGPEDQPKFLNAAGLLHTSLLPIELLNRLNQIEADFGRTRQIHWGPRTLDLDLIFYDDLIINTERLTLPHPLFSKRLFVLIPLTEIVPDFIDPVTKHTVSFLLKELSKTNKSSQNFTV